MMNMQMATRKSSTLAGNIAAYNQEQPMKSPGAVFGDDARWQAVLQRDRSVDGTFVFGVISTGVYCRPSCPARRPLRRNVNFFPSCSEAEKAGLRAFRFSQFKNALRRNSVTTAWADAGYSSPSRVYETARARLGMPPGNYRNGAEQKRLRFTTVRTPLGDAVLVASSEGVCSVQFLQNNGAEDFLQSEYPGASLERDDKGLTQWSAQLRQLIAGEKTSHSIPLDIRGTAFQQKVWQYLQKIPCGQTRSYSEIAHAIGRQSAVRAVATACAANNLAVLVPCHRVVHKNGSPEGYRWGTDRKRKLLKMERKELP